MDFSRILHLVLVGCDLFFRAMILTCPCPTSVLLISSFFVVSVFVFLSRYSIMFGMNLCKIYDGTGGVGEWGFHCGLNILLWNLLYSVTF